MNCNDKVSRRLVIGLVATWRAYSADAVQRLKVQARVTPSER